MMFLKHQKHVQPEVVEEEQLADCCLQHAKQLLQPHDFDGRFVGCEMTGVALVT